MRRSARRAVRCAGWAFFGRVLLGVLARRPAAAPSWRAVNHRGAPVSLLAGPVAVLSAAAGAAAAGSVPGRTRLAAVTASCAALAVGRYDDRCGAGPTKGIAGHLGALAGGRVSTGSVKIVGIGGSGLVAGALARGRGVDGLLAGALVAATANLVNLLDLRPGRAIKGLLLVGLPLLVLDGPGGDLLAGPLGAASAVLPSDLAEATMLGDAGANGLGALLGVGLAAGASRRRLVILLLLLTALTAASEVVSFSAVIDRFSPLRRLDRLGRRPPPG